MTSEFIIKDICMFFEGKMKKKIIIIILFTVILMSMFAGCHLFVLEKNNGRNIEEEKITLCEALLQIRHQSEIEIIQKEYGVKSKLEYAEYCFQDVDFMDQKMTFFISFNEDNYIHHARAYSEMYSPEENKKLDAQNITTNIQSLLKWFAMIFDEEIQSNYFVFSDEQLLDNSQESSYEKIKNGEAHLEFRVRDEDFSVWILKVERDYSGSLMCFIDHYYNETQYNDVVVNIDLTK